MNKTSLEHDQIKTASKLKVRLSTSVDDLDFLRPASLEFHSESRYSDIIYSHKKRDELFKKAMNNPKQYALFVAEYKDEPAGFLFCTIGEYIVGEGDLITTVYSYYVRKKYRCTMIGGKAALRLLTAAVKWSKMRDAREIMIHATSGIDMRRTDKFLRRTGFGTIGASYSLSMKQIKAL